MNLDSRRYTQQVPWDPLDPANTSDLSVTFDAHDDLGRSMVLDLYFVKIAHRTWEYHATLQGDAQELDLGSSGRLGFDAAGALETWIEDSPLVVPSATGHAVPLALALGHSTQSGGDGFDGITSRPEVSDVFAIDADGNGATIGRPCVAAPPRPAQHLSTPDEVGGTKPKGFEGIPHCNAEATATQYLVGNLTTRTELQSTRWDPRRPAQTSDFMTPAAAADADGRLAELAIYFRRDSVLVWDYHIVLQSTVGGLELGAGTLHFDEYGRLDRHEATRVPRLPTVTGEDGTPITGMAPKKWTVSSFDQAASVCLQTRSESLGLSYPRAECPRVGL